MKNFKNNKGFTLIELLVVLAIIGVLIALAIVGLRSAQASQRDTARKDITSQINAQLQSYQANTGAYPASNATFAGSGDFIDTANAAGCKQTELDVNGTCMGLDGLTVGSTLVTNGCLSGAQRPSISSNIELCYSGTVGSAGYTFGVYLEAANQTFYAAQ